MTSFAALLPELEDVIEHGAPARRAEALARITQLFLDGAAQFNEAQVGLFDDVLGRLVEEIEERALVELARALAPIDNAPAGVVRRLAQSEHIAVAGPVLQRSVRLQAPDLVEIARSRGQAHLMALACRPQVEAAVTDVLMRRGDRAVVRSLAGNASARLSEAGYVALVAKASQDGVLATQVGCRADIPAPLFRRLLLQATAVVQARLLAAAPPERQAEIRQVLARVADDVGAEPRRDYAAARVAVAALRRAGKLSEPALADYASAGAVEETAAALAALCRIPVEVVDRLVLAGKPDPILILCKAMNYGWPTAAAVLSLRMAANGPAMEGARRQFERLPGATAQRIIQFWRLRPAA